MYLTRRWHRAIPSKISILVWRLFHNKIATKDNFYRRGVINQGMLQGVGNCGGEESVSHLFF